MACSLTTEPHLVRPGDDPFDWGRFAAEDHDTAETLAAKLGGWHTLLRNMGRMAWSTYFWTLTLDFGPSLPLISS
jgi:hypothetical protein